MCLLVISLPTTLKINHERRLNVMQCPKTHSAKLDLRRKTTVERIVAVDAMSSISHDDPVTTHHISKPENRLRTDIKLVQRSIANRVSCLIREANQ